MNPSISVVIATKNYAQYISTAIESVLKQTLVPQEIIVIDDGSIDNTPQILQKFSTNPFVKVVRVEGLGVCRARNLGIELACGELIAFLDADDLWHPTKLERQIALFQNERVAVVYSQRELIDPTGQPLPSRQIQLPKGELFNEFLRTNPVCFSSAIVRRSVFDHIGFFDSDLSLAVDYDLWLRISAFYEFDVINEVLVKYRTGHANLSSRLKERVETIFYLLHRIEHRPEFSAKADPQAMADAWGSTCRSMGYAIRKQNRWQSAMWYCKAATYDGRWFRSIKSTVGTLLKRGSHS